VVAFLPPELTDSVWRKHACVREGKNALIHARVAGKNACPTTARADEIQALRSDFFNLQVAPDYEAMSRLAADVILDTLRENPRLLLGVATGSTPTRTYELLAAAESSNPALFSQVRLLKLDEWGGLAQDDPSTCEIYVQRHLLTPLHVSSDRYLGWRTNPDDPTAECRRIQNWLAEHGPIDLCLLGLGGNGHLAFNEPADMLQYSPHVAELSAESMRHPMLDVARARPRYGLTVGIGDIMRSRRVLLLVSGEHKATQLKRLLSGGITTRFPASLLSLHRQATILCDSAAASGVVAQT
jgi:galactosamine-6-phosphate isomerase